MHTPLDPVNSGTIQQFDQTTFSDIPDDVILHIMMRCQKEDVNSLVSCCKRYWTLVSSREARTPIAIALAQAGWIHDLIPLYARGLVNSRALNSYCEAVESISSDGIKGALWNFLKNYREEILGRIDKNKDWGVAPLFFKPAVFKIFPKSSILKICVRYLSEKTDLDELDFEALPDAILGDLFIELGKSGVITSSHPAVLKHYGDTDFNPIHFIESFQRADWSWEDLSKLARIDQLCVAKKVLKPAFLKSDDDSLVKLIQNVPGIISSPRLKEILLNAAYDSGAFETCRYIVQLLSVKEKIKTELLQFISSKEAGETYTLERNWNFKSYMKAALILTDYKPLFKSRDQCGSVCFPVEKFVPDVFNSLYKWIFSEDSLKPTLEYCIRCYPSGHAGYLGVQKLLFDLIKEIDKSTANPMETYYMLPIVLNLIKDQSPTDKFFGEMVVDIWVRSKKCHRKIYRDHLKPLIDQYPVLSYYACYRVCHSESKIRNLAPEYLKVFFPEMSLDLQVMLFGKPQCRQYLPVKYSRNLNIRHLKEDRGYELDTTKYRKNFKCGKIERPKKRRRV